MPGPSKLEIEFADGTYCFALNVTQILELQRVCDAGIFEIYSRVMRGRLAVGEGEMFSLAHEATAHVKDVLEVPRLALIGGGQGIVNGEPVKVDDVTARRLVEAYLHPPAAPLKKAWDLTAVILFSLIEGYEAPDTQKKSPVEVEVAPAG